MKAKVKPAKDYKYKYQKYKYKVEKLLKDMKEDELCIYSDTSSDESTDGERIQAIFIIEE
jgi:hypothetical protein